MSFIRYCPAHGKLTLLALLLLGGVILPGSVGSQPAAGAAPQHSPLARSSTLRLADATATPTMGIQPPPSDTPTPVPTRTPRPTPTPDCGLVWRRRRPPTP